MQAQGAAGRRDHGVQGVQDASDRDERDAEGDRAGRVVDREPRVATTAAFSSILAASYEREVGQPSRSPKVLRT
jgi:hypothetical protein